MRAWPGRPLAASWGSSEPKRIGGRLGASGFIISDPGAVHGHRARYQDGTSAKFFKKVLGVSGAFRICRCILLGIEFCSHWEGISIMVRLLKKSEVANLLNVSIQTIDRLRVSGDLRSVKVRGRVLFCIQDVEAFINSKRGVFKS